MAISGKVGTTIAATALAVGLFPTLRAIVNGSSSRATIARPPAASAVKPIVDATRAARAARAGSVRVLLVGNSVASGLAPGFRAIKTTPLAVLDESVSGCGFPPDLTDVTLTLPNGQTFPQPPCDPTWEAEVITRFRPNIVFWIVNDPLGTGGTFQGRHVQPCGERYDMLYRKRLRQEIAALGKRGAKVVIPTEAYSRYLGVANYDRATDCQNNARRVVTKATGAQLVDLFAYVCPKGKCRVTQDGVTLRPDGLHYKGPGGELIAQWLFDQVEP